MDTLFDLLRALFGAMVPPAGDATAEQVVRWHWAVFVGGLAVSGGFVAHVALACGFVPALFSGFASADEVNDLKHQATIASIEVIDSKIIDMQERWCAARDAKNEPAKQFATVELLRYTEEYFRLSGRAYPVPTCEQL